MICTMRGRNIRNGHGLKRTLALAALALFALRLAIPAGFMPAPAGDGFALVLCTAHGPQSLPSPTSGDSGAPEAAQAAGCPFAAGALALAAPAATAMAAPSWRRAAAAPFVHDTSVGASSRFTFGARAPPSLV